MSNIRISKIKARRGSNEQRKQVVFDQGELVYATDTRRFYIGDGVTIGGGVIGMKMHTPLINYTQLSSLVAERGDVVKADNSYYQLTASDYTNLNSWAIIQATINPLIFNYDSSNRLSINSDSLSSSLIKSSTVLSGIKISNGILQSDIDSNFLEITSNKISLKASAITNRELNSTAFGNGLTGGSGSPISLNVDTSKFQFDSGVLKAFNIPTTFGSGLVYNTTSSTLSSTLTNVEGALSASSAGVVDIKRVSSSGTNQWPKITVDQYGRVTGSTSSIYGTLTGSSSSGSLNNTNSLSSIFNGRPSHTIEGGIPGMELTQFTGISSNGVSSVVITLSSAGFITFEGGISTQTGQSVGRFAIPIFAY